MYLNSFPTRCINEWNNLPEEIVCKTSVESFKLDKLWLHKRFDTSTIYWLWRIYKTGTGQCDSIKKIGGAEQVRDDLQCSEEHSNSNSK